VHADGAVAAELPMLPLGEMHGRHGPHLAGQGRSLLLERWLALDHASRLLEGHAHGHACSSTARLSQLISRRLIEAIHNIQTLCSTARDVERMGFSMDLMPGRMPWSSLALWPLP
jgi:hypothetical protein